MDKSIAITKLAKPDASINARRAEATFARAKTNLSLSAANHKTTFLSAGKKHFKMLVKKYMNADGVLTPEGLKQLKKEHPEIFSKNNKNKKSELLLAVYMGANGLSETGLDAFLTVVDAAMFSDDFLLQSGETGALSSDGQDFFGTTSPDNLAGGGNYSPVFPDAGSNYSSSPISLYPVTSSTAVNTAPAHDSGTSYLEIPLSPSNSATGNFNNAVTWQAPMGAGESSSLLQRHEQIAQEYRPQKNALPIVKQIHNDFADRAWTQSIVLTNQQVTKFDNPYSGHPLNSLLDKVQNNLLPIGFVPSSMQVITAAVFPGVAYSANGIPAVDGMLNTNSDGGGSGGGSEGGGYQGNGGGAGQEKGKNPFQKNLQAVQAIPVNS